MSKTLAIKGHPTRGKEVIELLEMMGGNNAEFKFVGNLEQVYYYIWNNKIYQAAMNTEMVTIFTLEEFLEKYPFKVGDKVNIIEYESEVPITKMRWNGSDIEYCVVTCYGDEWFGSYEIKSWNDYEDMETKMNEDNYRETLENKVLGYNVDDIIFTNDTGWIRITKKLWDCYAEEHVYECIGILNGLEYKDIRHHDITGKMELESPNHCKTVNDARYVNSITNDIMINQITNKVSVIKLKPDVCDDKIELQLNDYEIEVRDGRTFAVKKTPVYPKTFKECCKIIYDIPNYTHCGYKHELLFNFQKLLICRDAYWKLANDWKPDWNSVNDKYTIYPVSKDIWRDTGQTINTVLAFPTIEMRDAFYENFKDLIEQCKELL